MTKKIKHNNTTATTTNKTITATATSIFIFIFYTPEWFQYTYLYKALNGNKTIIVNSWTELISVRFDLLILGILRVLNVLCLLCPWE